VLDPKDELPAKLLALRRSSTALRFGVRQAVAVQGPPSIWAFLRHDGGERVLVAANLAAATARATLEVGLKDGSLEPRFGTNDPLGVSKGRAVVELPARSVRVWSRPFDRRRFRVAFGRPGLKPDKAEVVEQGLPFDRARGFGFVVDRSEAIACRGDACRFHFAPVSGDPNRWSAEVPPGAYDVEISLAQPLPPHRSPLLIEGSPVIGSGKHIRTSAYVRDGLLSIEGARDAGAQIDIEGIDVAPGAFRAAKIELRSAADRVLVVSAEPGLIEWRMDGSTSEPAERAPLAKKGGRFEATLGPWPSGSVGEVALVIRDPSGRYLTAPSGLEMVVKIQR
jgi:hypothetical protein